MTAAAPHDPELALAIGYARAADRPALAALFALDAALAAIPRAARDPLAAQLRLTWWHDALAALDRAPAPAEPTLRALAGAVLPRGIAGAALAPLVEGWEVLIEAEALDEAALRDHAARRGGRLFALAAQVAGAGAGDPVDVAGIGWALADLARHVADPAAAAQASRLAAPALATATRARWSRNARTLGALAHLARLDLAVPRDRPIPIGAPHRVARIFWHRIAGG